MNKVVKLKSHQTDAGQPDAPVLERPSYTGGLAVEELKRPGGKLLAMLVARASQLGMKLNDMCSNELGCTYGYLHQLRNGVRQTPNISDDFATRCALFLGVPRLTVLMAAGRISIEDYYARPKMAAAEIRRAMESVMNDPIHGVDMHPEVMDLQLSTQFAIVRLYEQVTGKKLLDNALSLDSLVEQLRQLDDAVAQLKAQVSGAPQEAPAATV